MRPLVFGLAVACGAPPLHPLTLVSPRNDGCDANADAPCTPYLGCSDLLLKDLHIEVGDFSREVTSVACSAELQNGPMTVLVSYQPGQDFYMVDASFARSGAMVYLTAGPFREDETLTPWKLLLY